jgi:hypothetical protein
MLKKIISVKNVGRLRNSAMSGNPQLTKHTYIVGANGFGKPRSVRSCARSKQVMLPM